MNYPTAFLARDMEKQNRKIKLVGGANDGVTMTGPFDTDPTRRLVIQSRDGVPVMPVAYQYDRTEKGILIFVPSDYETA